MKLFILLVATAAFFFPAANSQGGPASASARAGIDAGNRAWIDGVKTANIDMILATYTENAVDCGPSGECFKGKLQIKQHMKTQLASLGRAHTAVVTTWGSTQQGSFAYEWGQAEATYTDERKLVNKYLTVWQEQPDGGWKILRNLVIPANHSAGPAYNSND
jgi:ketosteroid isomerase-like protein